MDDVPAREMGEYGLPTSFATSKNSMAESSSTTRKGEKKTFYCELCLVELGCNSQHKRFLSNSFDNTLENILENPFEYYFEIPYTKRRGKVI